METAKRTKLERVLFERNIAQKTLAEAAGVSQAYMSYVVTGKRIPSLPVIKVISDCLGITIDELARDYDIKTA